MKHMIYCIGLFATLFGFSLLFMAIGTKEMKQEELHQAVSQSMESALAKSMEEEATEETCISDFLQAMQVSLEGKGELTVEIYEVNIEKGLFRTKSFLEFPYMTGNTSSVSVEKTLIYDDAVGGME